MVAPDTLSVWAETDGEIRLFISHRDRHKAAAKELALSLEDYGISAFVAHDTIQPMTTWQHEILKGLQGMEFMLAFITDDFFKSPWTNQEIGYAICKSTPIISLKLENTDPQGFFGSEQALKSDLKNPAGKCVDIYSHITNKLGVRERLDDALIAAFVKSTSFNEAIDRFDRMQGVIEELSDNQLHKICIGFKKNDQLYGSIYLDNKNKRLSKFLEKTRPLDEISIEGRNIIIK